MQWSLSRWVALLVRKGDLRSFTLDIGRLRVSVDALVVGMLPLAHMCFGHLITQQLCTVVVAFSKGTPICHHMTHVVVYNRKGNSCLWMVTLISWWRELRRVPLWPQLCTDFWCSKKLPLLLRTMVKCNLHAPALKYPSARAWFHMQNSHDNFIRISLTFSDICRGEFAPKNDPPYVVIQHKSPIPPLGNEDNHL